MDHRTRNERFVLAAGEVARAPVSTSWEGTEHLLDVVRLSLAQMRDDRLAGAFQQSVSAGQSALNNLLQLTQILADRRREEKKAARAELRMARGARQRLPEAPPLHVVAAWSSVLSEHLGLRALINDGGDMRPETDDEARARVQRECRDCIARQFERAGAED